jgi:hypothetical protein
MQANPSQAVNGPQKGGALMPETKNTLAMTPRPDGPFLCSARGINSPVHSGPFSFPCRIGTQSHCTSSSPFATSPRAASTQRL